MRGTGDDAEPTFEPDRLAEVSFYRSVRAAHDALDDLLTDLQTYRWVTLREHYTHSYGESHYGADLDRRDVIKLARDILDDLRDELRREL